VRTSVPGRTGRGEKIDVSPTPVESKVRGGRVVSVVVARGCVCAAAVAAMHDRARR
jgi:hypothetical protein